MSLTNRILLAMVAGIALGSLLEWLMGALDPAGELHVFIENGFLCDILVYARSRHSSRAPRRLIHRFKADAAAHYSKPK